jgi:hypothetical protein
MSTALIALAKAHATKRHADRALVAANASPQLMVAAGIHPQAAAQVHAMVAPLPEGPPLARGMSAVDRIAADEPSLRAQYMVNAAWRLTNADNYQIALRDEQRYLAAHFAAAANRRAAAERIDKHVGVLRWVTAGDERVHPRCRRMEGRLFTARNLPDGLVPGGVRVGCRCRAVPWGNPLWAIEV